MAANSAFRPPPISRMFSDATRISRMEGIVILHLGSKTNTPILHPHATSVVL